MSEFWVLNCSFSDVAMLPSSCWTMSVLLFFVVGCSWRQYLPDSLQHWPGCASCLSCLSQHYDKYVIGSGNSGRFMNNLSQLLIYDENNQPKLGSDIWHNIIYTSQNNFKSSFTTRNWRKLKHAAILSCWRHFCMLRLSKILLSW